MDLLVVRHARAEDRDDFAETGEPDSKRPLTAKGIRRMTKAARGLRRLVPAIGVLASSPLRRAAQTAKILSAAYDDIEWVERDELSPGVTPVRLIGWLAARRGRGTVCVVGHEPDLSRLLAILLTRNSDRPRKLKKGSATLLRFAGPPAAREGELQWHRTAKELAAGT